MRSSQIFWWALSPGEGNGNPLQYSCLENPMDRGAWRATVHGVAKSQTQLSNCELLIQSCLIVTSSRCDRYSHLPERKLRLETLGKCPEVLWLLSCGAAMQSQDWRLLYHVVYTTWHMVPRPLPSTGRWEERPATSCVPSVPWKSHQGTSHTCPGSCLNFLRPLCSQVLDMTHMFLVASNDFTF